MVNPYTSRGPLQDPSMFFGRTHELSEIASFLQGNQSVSIVGPRKIGKTSLLLHLMRPETRAVFGIREENLFVYMDCQVFSNCQVEEIYVQFCTEIASALQTQGLEPEPALKAAVSKPTRPDFEFALRKLNQRGLRVGFILDEFEQLTLNPHVDVNFYNALRSAAGRMRLVFLTASAQPLIELTYFDNSKKILSSPFFNIFAQVFLGLLPESDARSLVRKPMEAAEQVISPQLEDFIYQLVGGHPLGLQVACFYTWENPGDLTQIRLQTVQELDAHFQYYWHNLSQAEQDLLRYPPETGLQEFGDPALTIVLRNLVRKCLLVKTDGAYQYPSKAWAEFVLSHTHEPGSNQVVEPPVQIRTADLPESGALITGNSNQLASPALAPGISENPVRRMLKESLPEAIGGLITTMIAGIATLIYTQYPAIKELIKSVYFYINPEWLVLGLIGVLAGVILAGRIVSLRKRHNIISRNSQKEPGKRRQDNSNL